MDHFPITLAAVTLATPVLGIIAASPWAERHRQSARAWFWAGIFSVCAVLPGVGPTLLTAALG